MKFKRMNLLRAEAEAVHWAEQGSQETVPWQEWPVRVLWWGEELSTVLPLQPPPEQQRGVSRGQLISPDAESAQEYLTTAEKWITPEDFLLEENFTLFWLEMEISEVFWTSLRGLSSLVELKMEAMVTLGINIS